MAEQSTERSLERQDTTVTLAFEELKLSVEAILFAADRPLEVTEIRDLIESVSLTDVRLAIKDLGHDFEGRSIEIIEVGRKYQLRTRASFAPTVTRLFSGKPRGLSRSALETLAIVAYRQPVTRAEINALRQVDSSQVVSSLRERELIYPSGTRKDVGHPVEYRTTEKFLDVFGLGALTELPKLRSLQMNIDDEQKVKEALKSLSDSPAELPLTAAELSFGEEEQPSTAKLEDDEVHPLDQDLSADLGGEESPTPGSKPTGRAPRPVRIDDSEGLARPVFTRPTPHPEQARPGATTVAAWVSDDLEDEGSDGLQQDNGAADSTLGPDAETGG